MIFENKRFVGKVKLVRLILLIGLCAILVTISQVDALDAYSFGLNRFIYVALACVIYIGISLYRVGRNYCYLYYSDDNKQLEVRYYHTVMFGSKYKMVRIPFAQLLKYEIETKFLKKSLVLFQKDGAKVSKYAGIPVTALEPEQLKMILANIDSHLNDSVKK